MNGTAPKTPDNNRFDAKNQFFSIGCSTVRILFAQLQRRTSRAQNGAAALESALAQNAWRCVKLPGAAAIAEPRDKGERPWRTTMANDHGDQRHPGG
jgi:hypothetical protein